MSKKEDLIVTSSFQCGECGLMYHDGDTITVRKIGEQPVHDCDNCLIAIELNIKGNSVTRK